MRKSSRPCWGELGEVLSGSRVATLRIAQRRMGFAQTPVELFGGEACFLEARDRVLHDGLSRETRIIRSAHGATERAPPRWRSAVRRPLHASDRPSGLPGFQRTDAGGGPSIGAGRAPTCAHYRAAAARLRGAIFGRGGGGLRREPHGVLGARWGARQPRQKRRSDTANHTAAKIPVIVIRFENHSQATQPEKSRNTTAVPK